MNQNFLLPQEVGESERTETGEWAVNLISLRDSSLLRLRYELGTMVVVTEHMALAADIVQSLAAYLNLDHLKVCP